MALIVWTLYVAVVVWLFMMLIFIELPSIKVISGMRKIQGPTGYPFLLGQAFYLMFLKSEEILDYISDIMTSYPRLAAFYVAGMPCVIIQNPEDLKHILGNSKHIKKGFEYEPIIPWLKQGLLTSYGLKWHQRRKLLTPSFHFQILEDAFSGMSYNTEILTNKLSESGEKPVEIDNYITACTLDIIAETAMGVKLDVQSNPKNEYLVNVKNAAESIIKRIISIYQLKDYIYAATISGWNFRKTLKILHGFTEKVIADKKHMSNDLNHYAEDHLGRKQKKAFLDCLLDMQRNNPQMFTDLDIREEVDTFMFEGHDTTSTALCFGLWLLGSNMDVQEKLYQEITEAVGDGEMTMNSLNRMNYLERVIKETLRLYPSVPYISRKTASEVVLDDGMIIPETANIMIIPYLLHRNPEHFPEPERFDPDRFTEEASKNRHPYIYIPFSAGPRNCVGQKFAMLEMKITLASVVRRVKIEAITKREEFKILPHLIIRPTVPLQCRFISRTK